MSGPRFRAPPGTRRGQSRLWKNRQLRATAGRPRGVRMVRKNHGDEKNPRVLRGDGRDPDRGYGGISPHHWSNKMIFNGNYFHRMRTRSFAPFRTPLGVSRIVSSGAGESRKSSDSNDEMNKFLEDHPVFNPGALEIPQLTKTIATHHTSGRKITGLHGRQAGTVACAGTCTQGWYV
ncbi:MAG: hypothetical protein A4E34_00601 [Methanoregula sp. PtaU1.Bin006]|nr:MAG: hypothetical protein A4E33_02456 [Methanoregula sp. PtaB.Bin085]OPY35601.1 MAG: hypothetical protein A4E34_00601 [Methanoregula sp. PtaU1.Bin006]